MYSKEQPHVNAEANTRSVKVHPNDLAMVLGLPVPYPLKGTIARNVEASKHRQTRFERRVLAAAGENVCETDACETDR